MAMASADPINPQRVAYELSERLPEDSIVTADSGTTSVWYARNLRFGRGMMGSVSGTLATMGCSVPYAIAAKFAHPGRPVIALDAGGVRETIIEGTTGAFYPESDPDALAEVVAAFDPLAVDPAACVASAMRFDTTRFGPQLKAVVAETASRLQAERVPRVRSRRRAATTR